MNKLDIVWNYIDKCDEAISCPNDTDVKKLQKEIIDIFGSKIKNIQDQLSHNGHLVDYLWNIGLLKSKLEYYALNNGGDLFMNMDRQGFIQKYIDKCDEVLSSADNNSAEKLQKEIVGIFSAEIKNIQDQIDKGPMTLVGSAKPRSINYLGNIELLKPKLEYHKISISN